MRSGSRHSSPILVVAGVAFSQQPDTKIAFEVASVRPSPPHSGASIRGLEISGDRVHVGPMALVNLIALAYGVQNYQVQCPAWLTSPSGITLFDVDAKAPGGSSGTAVPQMLFSLSAEIGSTDVDALVLLVAKGGPQLQHIESGGNTEAAGDYKGIPLIQLGGIKFANGTDGAQHVEASNIRGLIG